MDKKGNKVLGKKMYRKRSNSLQDDVRRIQQSAMQQLKNSQNQQNLKESDKEMKQQMKLALSKMNECKIDGIKIFSMEIQDDSYDQFTKSIKLSEYEKFCQNNQDINSMFDWQNLGKPSLLRRKMISSQKLNGKDLILNSHRPIQMMEQQESNMVEPEIEKIPIIELRDFVDYSQTPQEQLENSKNECIFDAIDMFVQVENDRHKIIKIEGGIQNCLIDEDENGQNYFHFVKYFKEVMYQFYDKQFQRGYQNCTCRYCCLLEYPIMIEKSMEPQEFEKLHQKYAELFMKNPESQMIDETMSQQGSCENLQQINDGQRKESSNKYSNLQMIMF